MLDVSHLVREFANGQGRRVQAVRDVSFSVPRGEFFTLLGPSGCGKTTTLRAIAGLERPEGGEIVFAGTTLYSAAKRIMIPGRRRNIGMVFQSYAIWPHMSVFENAAFPLRVAKKPEKEIAEKVARILAMVSLDGMEDRRATQLSGGQQQRLALARALVNAPQLLLLDEPLSNLDAKLRERMRFELKRLQRDLGLTTIFVTHDQNEALALSDKIAVMSAGEIVQIGTPREIYDRPRTQFVADFIGSTNLFEGIVLSVLDGRHVVRTAIGHVAAQATESFSEGTSVLVSIRPEQISLCDGGGQAHEATVLGRVFLGERQDIELRVGQDVLIARADPSTEVSIGGTVHFTVEQHCAVFAGAKR
jgi:iron(III) transport system ATP-binding protein